MAQAFLVSLGYTVLDTNYRSRGGELDIVCQLRELVVFVEVKTRRGGSRERPEQALNERKRRKLVRAASAYLSRNSMWGRPCRFDLVSVTLNERDCRVEHVPHVIELPEPLGGGNAHWQPW
jgi:putative endonuclease